MTMSRCRKTTTSPQPLWLLLTAVAVMLWNPIPCCLAYRVGDPIDTVVWTTLPGGTVDRAEAMRAQMPSFGISNSASFPQLRDRFSLGFEEGLWGLPWTEVKNLMGETLDTLTVTFVYSKSGGGAIHSVTSAPKFRSRGEEPSSSQLRIEYQWMEEEPVDIQSGSTLMFLATLISAVIFLTQACGLGDDMGDADDEDHDDNDVHFGELSLGSGSKWN